MSKYEPLWNHVAGCSEHSLRMTFDQITDVLGFPIDHSFLTFKKELTQMGWSVCKVSLKNKVVDFVRIEE